MSNVAPQAVDMLEAAIDEKIKKAQSVTESTHIAQITNIDSDGTVWVRVAGADSDTPTYSNTVSYKVNDTVTVRIANGKASINGNQTNPSIGVEDMSEAKIEINRARSAAGIAQENANTAIAAAGDAVNSSIIAAERAEAASESSAQAKTAAEAAETRVAEATEAAYTAQSAANQANTYAINALAGLSDVEKVVGTLEWVAEHGTYSLTTDDSPAQNKPYYEYNGEEYILVSNPNINDMFSYAKTQDADIDPTKVYYRHIITYSYELTKDTEIDPEKDYYKFEEGEYILVDNPIPEELPEYFERIIQDSYYEPVTNPDISEISSYYERTTLYYELNLDSSIQNYINSHLSLVDEGLYVVADDIKYRLLLAADGMRVIDPEGKLVGLHGDTIQLGSTDGIYFSATNTMLAFRTLDQAIAYFGLNSDGIWEMHIDTAYVDDMMRYGDYAFIKRANGNMSLKWLGE